MPGPSVRPGAGAGLSALKISPRLAVQKGDRIQNISCPLARISFNASRK
jgi:hypothetical protein